MKKLEFHEIANAFPLMEGDEFSELCADVKEHGMREQGVMLDGKILDGRNRYRAALASKVYMPFRNFDPAIDGESAVAFVISANLRRRHLDASQRAMAAAKIANLNHGQKKSDASIEASGVSQDDAAQTFGVSRSAVQRAAKVLDNAPAAVVKAIESGDVAVADAAAVADLPKSEQAAALKKVDAGKAKTLRQAAGPKKKTKPNKRYELSELKKLDAMLGKMIRLASDVNKHLCPSQYFKDFERGLNTASTALMNWRSHSK